MRNENNETKCSRVSEYGTPLNTLNTATASLLPVLPTVAIAVTVILQSHKMVCWPGRRWNKADIASSATMSLQLLSMGPQPYSATRRYIVARKAVLRVEHRYPPPCLWLRDHHSQFLPALEAMQPVLEDWGDISTKKASYNRLAALVMSLPAMGHCQY
jgi:hypothetical protein